MFAFDLNILSEEEKNLSPFLNNITTSDNKDSSSKKKSTRKQKNMEAKKRNNIKVNNYTVSESKKRTSLFNFDIEPKKHS